MEHIEIEYDGRYPNLCSGKLLVTIDNTTWEFPKYSLVSGGGVSFDENWSEDVSCGPWSIWEWPIGFPDALKAITEIEINKVIPYGCCGGCV